MEHQHPSSDILPYPTNAPENRIPTTSETNIQKSIENRRLDRKTNRVAGKGLLLAILAFTSTSDKSPASSIACKGRDG